MDFRLLRRPNGRLVLIPRLFHAPAAAGADLDDVGEVHVSLERLSATAVASLGTHGFAEATDADAELIALISAGRGA